ncbi:probable anion transporter 6, chloroplastic isoform X1 [Selaginella moellendorffii]|uniref:probable anion transporter 6, chloroplastic isoform X1 n=1 Tax=Selaginella moellendorffii TaxID=88036 RepID=UPI000D1CA6F6|nr:probable anion transporter 6, chloroplastic isoform X1 [Selaginella moellendorffii]|eukprot:XP_024532841.1 probable anion transporter 6, chloroplastic isoform X1 [Selaginella moellendorffii]
MAAVALCLGLPRVATKISICPRSSPLSTKHLRLRNGSGPRFHCVSQDKEDEITAIPSSTDTASVSWNQPKYRVILMASLAFVICNMDKVNLSVAIIPMSQQFGWPATTSGLVQSSLFLGYAFSQLPGGWLSRKFSGKYVLRGGVFLWSLATMAVPLSARYLPLILASRVMVGVGEGVSPSAATDLVARTVSANERSRAVSVIFGGLSVGSIAGLLFAPVFIENFGWQSVFYVFGLLGLFWCLLFNPEGCDSETDQASADNETGQPSKVPWSAFFKSPPVWAMIYAHFCGNWGYFTLLSWMPTFVSDELHLNLTNAALISILPPLASVPVTSFAAVWADSMITSGLSTTVVRKICQSIAFLSPSASMSIVSLVPSLPPWSVILLLTSGIGLSSFALSGLYCTHQDISRKYAGILLGITNTAGAIPGVVGVAATGYIFDQTDSWTEPPCGTSLQAANPKISSKSCEVFFVLDHCLLSFLHVHKIWIIWKLKTSDSFYFYKIVGKKSKHRACMRRL